jgi:lipopolysaccharide/colanic/teichoic acid biosynthesis glycosyltransferase
LFDEETLLEYRHYVPTGITGWAQVTHGFAVDEARRELEHDLYYVKYRSAALDLLIFYLTLKKLRFISGVTWRKTPRS